MWKNHCNHPKSSFKGTVNNKDVYYFDNNGRMEVCIRYGDRPEEYISGHTIKDLISILRKFPNIEYTKDFEEIINLLKKE